MGRMGMVLLGKVERLVEEEKRKEGSKYFR